MSKKLTLGTLVAVLNLFIPRPAVSAAQFVILPLAGTGAFIYVYDPLRELALSCAVSPSRSRSNLASLIQNPAHVPPPTRA